MRLFALLVITLALAGCGAAGGETPVEEAEAEDTGIEEATREESTEARSETTAPSVAATNPEAAQSEQLNARREKEGVAKDQGQAQASQVRPETTAPSAATNSGAVRSEQANASPGEEEDSARIQQGVSTSQKADPDPATVGQPLTFTVSVTNHSAPQRVGFKDFLPPSMTLVSATPSQGTCGTGHHGGNEVGCTLGLVPSGGSATVEIVATPTVPGTMKNTAVSLAEFTPATPANSSVANVTVNPAS
ncbi:MAG: DUF11 domain-containing protein [Actinomycetota bacterium]|nr:DUF11 domain-containing protein [Actinomycetota bacterium]